MKRSEGTTFKASFSAHSKRLGVPFRYPWNPFGGFNTNKTLLSKEDL